jgi:lipase
VGWTDTTATVGSQAPRAELAAVTVTRTLHLHTWGAGAEPGALEPVVFLHGVTGHGGHARLLAEDWLVDGGRRVLAPDLLGHGSSPYEPPWSIDDHLDAITDTVGPGAGDWVGHSFGARLAFELAARRPAAVRRLVMLDPALHVPPAVALFAAEHARQERTYVSFAEAVERRFEESQLHGAPRALVEEELSGHLVVGDDGLWRYRYCQAAVVAAYGELASTPPPFDAVQVPTLLVLGAHSYLPYDHLLEDHREALGDLLVVHVVDGGHTVLWDALEETASAIAAFLDH